MIVLIEARSVTPGDRVKHPVSMSSFRRVDRVVVLPGGWRWLKFADGGVSFDGSEQIWRIVGC
jgi:hypothetical protein